MKINMYQWADNILKSKIKKSLPVLSFPGMQLIGTTVPKMVVSGELQARCMQAIAQRYDTYASVSLMDLSVEAEAFGSPITLSDLEVPTVSSRIIITEEDAKNLSVPAVGAGRTGEYIKTIEYATQYITDRPILAGVIGPFSLSGRLMDMTEIMINCIEEPDFVHTVLEKATQFILEYVKALKAAGANGVVIAEPATGLLSPGLCAGFSVPYVKKIIEAVQDENFLVVYHNCGNTIPLIKDLLTMGARAYHFGNAIDLSVMAKLIPSNTIFMGNVDPAREFRNGTPESITKATNDLLQKCGSYLNYIPSSGCDIPPQSSLDNIDAFLRTVKEYYAGK
jgi:uroporphyrinogen decarboxylase